MCILQCGYLLLPTISVLRHGNLQKSILLRQRSEMSRLAQYMETAERDNTRRSDASAIRHFEIEWKRPVAFYGRRHLPLASRPHQRSHDARSTIKTVEQPLLHRAVDEGMRHIARTVPRGRCRSEEFGIAYGDCH